MGVGRQQRAGREIEDKEGYTFRWGRGGVGISGRFWTALVKSAMCEYPSKKRLLSRASPMATVLKHGTDTERWVTKKRPS